MFNKYDAGRHASRLIQSIVTLVYITINIHNDCANEATMYFLPKLGSDLISICDLGGLHRQRDLLVVLAVAMKLAGL